VKDDLLPLQERAKERHGVLEGNSLVHCIPSSAGKTLAGEFAAIKGVMEKKKDVYLVPMVPLIEFLTPRTFRKVPAPISSGIGTPFIVRHGTGRT